MTVQHDCVGREGIRGAERRNCGASPGWGQGPWALRGQLGRKSFLRVGGIVHELKETLQDEQSTWPKRKNPGESVLAGVGGR